MRTFLTTLFVSSFFIITGAQSYVSPVWVADQGDGTYKNPILYSDYSDPDVCRVGDDYYMTASSFNCIPGLQILQSKDLVNWKLIGAAVPKLTPEDVFSKPQHGNGIWAPSIRYHNNEFYIFYGDPDYGIYMTKAKNAEGPWDSLTLVKPGKGLIDACPLWDEDGRVYCVHGFAGSRASYKSVLAIFEMNKQATKAISDDVIVFDGHENHPTIEGPKFYKKDGIYYIFAPGGGVPTGWQTVLKSENVYGPYEDKIVLAREKTDINGPHQGGWVTTQTGEDWFIHFQDVGPIGRIIHLQPMSWKNGWPIIGVDTDNNGIGEPVLAYKKPNVGKSYPIVTPDESDEFNDLILGLQWQWHGNFSPLWIYNAADKGVMRLYSVPVPDNYKNLWDVPNLLLQKIPAPKFSATTKLTFKPNPENKGERTGLVVMGRDYGVLAIEDTDQGLVLSQCFCKDANKGKTEVVNESIPLKDNTVYLKVSMTDDVMCQFSYSFNGKKFNNIGKSFKAREGQWIGAKTGLFINRHKYNKDAGWIDVDWFRIDK
ncbi:MAG: glycoside hydrolase 43 family protein [Marinilabiliaceae bacterium]|nr:glycoside hydrolase 43 family protein [Marinilabiliaceae bacterium]